MKKYRERLLLFALAGYLVLLVLALLSEIFDIPFLARLLDVKRILGG